MWGLLFVAFAAVLVGAECAGAGAARLVCYVENSRVTEGFSECTHLVYTGDARGDKLDSLLKEYRKNNPRLKIILRVAETDKDLRTLLKLKNIQGIEIHDAHKTLNRTKVVEKVEAAKAAIASTGGGPLFLSLPAHPELLAKYYDLRALVKKADLMMVETHALGVVKKMTYHPSRLSGLWDMMNTDSVVDLVVGLGVPASKIVISLPATGRQFTLLNETLSTPGSPTTEDEPKEIGQANLCRLLQKGRWTLERDQDLSAPYAFKNKTWISFEDASSVDVKGKYARVRGLAGIALYGADRDTETTCGPSLKQSLAKVLNQQSRAPRAAVLRSLEHEILSAPGHARALDALQVSPYRITQVVDSDGVIHSLREDTRTEFSCSRQGYFVHPRSCARFYRCVKFDQLSSEYTVFEFDCPAGLAFDSRYEVCVWPGSLPHSQACPGSSEIAPVPQTRFICPEHEGYYADPENCRWFFACLDHGKAPLSAYEFRCPFGLGFDASRLICDWPWNVPNCGNIARYEAEAHGFSAAILTGAAGFQGQTADAVNVAAHNSLVSGASLNNLVGIQGGFLTRGDALDSNFIASQELANENGVNGGNGLLYHETDNLGLVQPTSYNNKRKYTSGSLILDEYRLPTEDSFGIHDTADTFGHSYNHGQALNINHGSGTVYSQDDVNFAKNGVVQGLDINHSLQAGFENSGIRQSTESGSYTGSLNLGPIDGHIHSGQAYKVEVSHGQSAFGGAGLDAGIGSTVHSVTDGIDVNGGIKQLSQAIDVSLGQSAGFSKDVGLGLTSVSGNQGSNGFSTVKFGTQKTTQYNSGSYEDNSGAYIHDPSGDYAEPYRHVNSPDVPYKHDATGYKHTGDTYDTGKYSGSYDTGKYSGSYDTGKYLGSNDAGKYSGSSDAGKYPDGFDTGKYSGSYDSSKYSDGSDSGQYIDKYYNGKYTSSYDNGQYRGTYDSGKYRTTYESGKYSGSTLSYNSDGQYVEDNSGQYVHDNSGTYIESDYKVGLSGSSDSGYTGYLGTGSGYNGYNSGSYKGDNSGKYEAGVYRTGGHIGSNEGVSKVTNAINHGSYSQTNSGNYISGTNVYTGAPHTLTAGAVNVGLVGKTTLIDVNYSDQNNYDKTKEQSLHVQHHTLHPAQVSLVSQPAVSINHVGTDEHNLDGYSFVTTPTSSGIPTTATPFAVTTSLPVITTYKTTYVPEVPKTSIKQIFGVSQPTVTYVQPTVVAVKQYSTPNIQITGHSQSSNYQNNEYSSHVTAANQASKPENSGYVYSKPSIKFEEGITYTTPAPVISTYRPHSFSQQTVHKVETDGYQYSTLTPVTEEPFKKLVAYTTGPPVVTYQQPEVSTLAPQTFSHQTIHKVETSHDYKPLISTGVGYDAGIVQQPAVVQYTTVQPTIQVQPVISTYQPQVLSHQTLHQVDASQVNTFDESSSFGYKYKKPAVKLEGVNTFVEYTTAVPVVTSYKPKSYSHQTIHKVERKPIVYSTASPQLNYQQPAVSVYQNPILKYIEKVTPASVAQSNYRTQSNSYQTIHKSNDKKLYTPSVDVSSVNYDLSQSINYQQPEIIYTTTKPVIQPVVSTYKPQVFSQQTVHQVDANHITGYSENNAEIGYNYEEPAIKFEDGKNVFEYSTPTPAVVTTYKPQTYSHQTFHKIESPKVYTVSTTASPIAKYTYKQADVSTYENPFLKNTQTAIPVTYVQPTASILTQTYQPEIHQHEVTHVSQPLHYEVTAQKSQEQNVQIGHNYTYNQPEIQRNIETSNTKYSDASVVSHQVFHQSHAKNDFDSGKDTVIVSSTPSTIHYQDHYIDYESPKTVDTYKLTEYVSPKVEYQQSYSVSTDSTPIVHHNSVIHKTSDEIDYKPVEYTQHYENIQPQTKQTGSINRSRFSGRVTTNYKQGSYESPEIQVGYKNEEYLPPVVSTVVPIITSTYRPRVYSTVSTTKEYLPPAAETTYSFPSTTTRSYIKSTTPYKALEYLSPIENEGGSIVNFESFGFDKSQDGANIQLNTYQDYSVPKDISPVSSTVTYSSTPSQRKQNIVVETAKSNLLGFGTVGPDAGLVSPATYTTSIPIVSTTYQPRFKSTTQKPYKYVQSTTTDYQAPEYLPPADETNLNYDTFAYKNVEDSSSYTIKANPYKQETVIVSTSAPKRKQNIVVETAKSHLLGFGTVGPDAGLVSPVTYTTAAPAIVSTPSYSVAPQTVTTSYEPIQQGLFEVTHANVPIRRTKPKVAVVTKINDFNPLLVRKLGAVCSCQSPVLILKGKRPTVQNPDFDDYTDGDDYGRGDIKDEQYSQRVTNIQAVPVASSPIVSTTYNPIIVPDDSFYQDYQEHNNYQVSITPRKEVHSESYVSSTPAVYSPALKSRSRQRVKTVTAAPTYKTVLLNQEVAPIASDNSETVVSAIDSGAFDRYGPGGWRSRDETLQGTVDCKRAGLFRHPKQCNKFYACRWDCTKQRFTLHVFNCPVQLSFDSSIGACNWPSQGPACQGDTLLTNAL
ncbi:hypothetical protein K1T71_007399 [Dendrolimus kikuchii]|uniref:Uncharacterized protein n=1 Tax=Dendrolimus kikuchii TaxID=765133 RepID=A0ACC1D0G9_9NEOP|nr:hypothetical protein K1T71_007399 [Dendrolimus kikuchii]